MEIDFVVPWVDGNDPDWNTLRNSYSENYDDVRYRNWDTFKYFFRSIEKYASWVRKVHLITNGQIPDWLQVEHPKLNLIFHKEYIPDRYLPTFSSHPIELNLHRIHGLTENFVYFNDDICLCSPCKKEDFFKNGLPCDAAILDQLTPYVIGNQFVHILCNNTALANTHFNKNQVLKKNPLKWFHPVYGKCLFLNLYFSLRGCFAGFRNFHLPQAFRKSDFEELWKLEPQLLEQTSSHRFRDCTDINQYAVRILNLCKGEFHPVNPAKRGNYFEIGVHDAMIADYLRNQKRKMICINDIDSEDIDFEKEYQFIHDLLEEVFPQKSSFEK